jgi:ABC-type lipoprotein release transport system permease subunit
VNYDQLFGNPYVETDTDIVTPLVSQPGVVALSAAHIGALTLDGVETPALAVDPVKGGLLPTVLDGRAPTGPDEIGLGRQAARRLHVGIGSDVTATGPSGSSRQLRVVGIVVTPDSAGDGAAISFDTYASLNPTATRNLLLARFGPGTSALSAEIAAANYSPPDALPAPTSVVALRKVVPAPAVLAIILSVLLLVGFTYMLVTSLLARQPDFAILRALGAVRRQLRQAVHWQSTITAGLVTAVGVPLGLVLGRWVVQQLTQTLGLVPGVDVPVLTLLGFVLATLAAANVVAVIPARRAARISGRSLGPDR